MKARNVIISLLFTIVLFVFVFMKIRSEPRRKLIFNRNPSKVEYSELALCLMSCQQMTANDITYIVRHGDVINKTNKHNCPSYVLKGKTRAGQSITVYAIQCGRAIKIYECFKSDHIINCNCRDENARPVSFL
jgi:hypothetical protein